MADLNYLYDSAGQVIGVNHNGQEREIPASDRAFIPGKHFDTMLDTQTSIRSTVESMKDTFDGDSIIVDIEATHGGYANRNYFHYLTTGMKRAVDTWTNPHPKPYLLEHNSYGDPRGRVIGAKFVSTGKSTGYHALDARIGHKEEIEMILDMRALTVSVGSKPIDTVECAVCAKDLFRDGNGIKKYKIPKAPNKAWLHASAPSYWGRWGMTNEEFWEYEEVDGTHFCTCRHIRGLSAPMGGKDSLDTFWYLHEQVYNEVSRVNVPADVNEATGEFAHIRTALEQTDGLEPILAQNALVAELSKVSSGPVNRSRFYIASEKDLWRPTTANEAMDFVDKAGYDSFFDNGLWLAVSSMSDNREQQIDSYLKQGGRFINKDQSPTEISVSDALKLNNPSEFGNWLRKQNLTREEKRSLDSIYTQSYLKRLV